MSEVEIWRNIPGYENIYQASNLGNIKSIPRRIHIPTRNFYRDQQEIILTYNPNSKRYPKVSLYKNREVEIRTIHTIVGLLFVPNPKNLPFLNHINGIKTDPRACNLEWCSHLENMQHAFKTGLVPNGERNHKAKLTDHNVRVIKRLFRINPNSNQSYIAKKLGVGRSTINAIVKNKKWIYVQ